MDIIYPIIKSALGMGLIFFILNKAIKMLKIISKAWINISVGLLFAIVFGLSLLVDYRNDNRDGLFFNIMFLAFALVFAISYALYYFISRYGNIFASGRNLESKHYYRDFVYLVYRHGNLLYLKKDKSGFYGGVVSRAKKSRFLEDVIDDLIKETRVNISPGEINRLGKITIKNRKAIYHCFYAKIPAVIDLNGFEEINVYDAAQYPMKELDKEIIYRVIINEKFDIEK
ncbi:MAG: hypothetical protein WBL36_02780 [Bacilli bacterium]